MTRFVAVRQQPRQFHLPGKHNQKTHGHRAISGVMSRLDHKSGKWEPIKHGKGGSGSGDAAKAKVPDAAKPAAKSAKPETRNYVDLGHDPPKDFVTHSKDWQKSLTADETKAIKGYAGKDYRAINGGLRGKAPRPEKATVDTLDRALAKSSLDRDVTLFRGMNAEALAGLQPGQRFTDHGYGSTSVSRTVSRQFAQKRAKRGGGAVVEIRAKQGTHGAYLDKMGNFAEREFLLPRDTTFRVVSIAPPKNKLDYPTVVMEIV